MSQDKIPPLVLQPGKTIQECMLPEHHEASRQFFEALEKSVGLTADELSRFDEATDHPYECGCELCLEWWSRMPPEDEEDSDPGDEVAF